MPNFPQITRPEAARRQASGALLLDVRSPSEYAAAHPSGAINLPLENIPAQIRTLATPNQPILLYCTHGQRSHSAALVLTRLGYRNLFIVK